MKCPRCGLQNLEGIEVCVKCKYQLVGLFLPEGFSPEPPRAGRLQRIRLVYWKWKRSRKVVLPENPGEKKLPFWQSPVFKMFYCEEPLPGSLLAMFMNFLLPGSGQFIMERFRRGIVFLVPAVISLIGAYLAFKDYNIGVLQFWASIFLMCQCISIFDATPRIRAYRLYDWFVNLMVAALLWFGCYAFINRSIYYSTRNLWDGVELRNIQYAYNEQCQLQAGDTVALRTMDDYQRGNIVIYQCSMPYLYDNSVRLGNYEGIDKIVGLPGETVSVKDGVISINLMPLENQDKLTLLKCKIPDMNIKLGKEEFFIYPSIINIPIGQIRRVITNHGLTVINKNNIRGRIIRIVAPGDRRTNL